MSGAWRRITFIDNIIMAKPKLKGLGRGLDALLAVNHTEDRLMTLPLSAITPGRYQPRSHMDEASLEQLAASIRTQGVIQPIVVRELGLDDYELIAGERRWRASQRAGISEIPAVVRCVPDESALAIALIENIQREQLNPLEEAQGIQRLIDEFGLTHEAAADAVGRSRSAVSNLLRLLQLAAPVQALVHDGALDMGHARALLPLPVLQQIELAQHIAERGLSVREAEKLAQEQMQEKKQAGVEKVRDPDILRLEESVSEAVGSTVSIRHGTKGRGKISIEYDTLDQLDGLLARLTKVE